MTLVSPVYDVVFLVITDVVKAYKSQSKEKEVLEASLKALSRSKPLSRQISTPKSQKSEGENESDTTRSEAESDATNDGRDQVKWGILWLQ